MECYSWSVLVTRTPIPPNMRSSWDPALVPVGSEKARQSLWAQWKWGQPQRPSFQQRMWWAAVFTIHPLVRQRGALWWSGAQMCQSSPMAWEVTGQSPELFLVSFKTHNPLVSPGFAEEEAGL